MSYRRVLLHVMLWSLGLGAVLGAAAVFMRGGAAYWRISGTTFMTAVAAGLLIPISRLVDRPATRPAGLFGMCLIVAEFLLGLVAIWGGSFLSNWFTEALGLTMLFLPLCGGPAAVLLKLAQGDPRGRWAGRAGVVLALVCFILLLAAAWLTTQWQDRQKLMDSAGIVGVYALMLIACLAGGSPKPELRPLLNTGRTIGVLASLLGASIALYALWYNIQSDSGLFRVVTSIAAVAAHANLCLLVPLLPVQRWVLWATVAAAVCTAVCLNIALSADRFSGDAAFAERGASAAGIITACGSLALVVLARINRRIPSESRELAAVSEIRLICPGCERKQTLPVGRSDCPTCRLKFEIRVEEPRCPRCDYLLFMLRSDRCPECGELLGGPGQTPGGPAPLPAAGAGVR